METIQFHLTDQQMTDALRTSLRHADGRLIVDIPRAALATDLRSATPLRFSSATRTVSTGRHATRLSPRQFELLAYLYPSGQRSYGAVQDAIWGHPVSDDTIRKAASKLSGRLSAAAIPYVVSSRQGHLLLESLAN